MHAMEDQTVPEKPRKRHHLVLFLLWLLFTLAFVALGYPRVKTSIEESGVLSLLASTAKELSTQQNKRSVDVVFALYPDTYQSFSIQQDRQGGSAYHDTFEALLEGPTVEVLKKGAVSYIHPDANLIGVTLSSKILYVDLSKEYLNSYDMQRARMQIQKTALLFSRVKDVVLLVEGKELT